MARGFFLTLSIVTALLASVSCPAADYYVATNGNDSGPGTQAEPFATIAMAITTAKSAIARGEASATVHLADGTYTEHSLVLDDAVTVVGNTVDPSKVIVDANETSGKTVFSLSHANAVVRGLTVYRAKGKSSTQLTTPCGGAFFVDAGLVADCIVDNNNSYVASSHGVGAFICGGHVMRCVFRNCSYWGVTRYTSVVTLSGGILENCLFTANPLYQDHASHRPGLIAFSGNGSPKVVNCTIVANGKMNMPFYRDAGTPTVVDCVMYGNNGSSPNVVSEWGVGDIVFVNSAAAAAVPTTAGSSGNRSSVTAASFVDFANGNYTPAMGVLVNGGVSAADYAAYGAQSTTDLAGNARTSGSAIDIGAYEHVASGLEVQGASSACAVKTNAVVTFTAMTDGETGDVSYCWDFKDGTTPVWTSERSVTHAFAAAGSYAVTVKAKTSAQGETASVSLQNAIVVLQNDVYVSESSGNDTYAGTLERPFKTLTAALAAGVDAIVGARLAGLTYHLADGTYAAPFVTFDVPIEVIGNTADPSKVIVDANDNTSGTPVFSLSHANAVVRGLTVYRAKGKADNSTPSLNNSCGGAFLVSGGLVEDCAVSNISYVINAHGVGALIRSGRMSRCTFTGVRYYGLTYRASAVTMQDGVLENCLFTANPLDQNNADRRPGLIAFSGSGSPKVVNCTIVANGKMNMPFCRYTGTPTVADCVMYGNNGDSPNVVSEWGSGDIAFINSAANAESPTTVGSSGNLSALSSAAFKDFSNADFRPAKGGALVEKGLRWSEYLALGALSPVDLLGNPRKLGSRLDIGAYEVGGAGMLVILK